MPWRLWGDFSVHNRKISWVITICDIHKIWHSVLITSCTSVVVANSHFILQIYSLSCHFFTFLTPNGLLILIEYALRKKDKNLCLIEFTLLPFLKLRTVAPSTYMDSFTCHLCRNSWHWRSAMFTLVKCSFLTLALAYVIKEIGSSTWRKIKEKIIQEKQNYMKKSDMKRDKIA